MYNQFYHDFSILKEEDAAKRNFRLVLSACGPRGEERHGPAVHRGALAHVIQARVHVRI
jgi:hypothetical protein